MAQTTPPSVDALPTAPQTSDGAVLFASRADAFVAALATLRSQLGALATNVYNNAVDCYNNAVAAAASVVSAAASASAASSSAAAAATSAGAAVWSAGTFAAGVTRYSPLDGRIYRSLTVHTGSTDPSADATNWRLIALSQPVLVTVTGTSHAATAGTLCLLTNVAATTVTLPASPAVDDVVQVMPANGLYTNLIDGNGKNINGDATITIDNAWACVTVRYISIAIGWRIM